MDSEYVHSSRTNAVWGRIDRNISSDTRPTLCTLQQVPDVSDTNLRISADFIDLAFRAHLSLAETYSSASLGTRVIRPIKVDLNSECPICYDPLSTAANVSRSRPDRNIIYAISQHASCRNFYHSECLNTWARSQRFSGKGITCPTCRGTLMSPPAPRQPRLAATPSQSPSRIPSRPATTTDMNRESTRHTHLERLTATMRHDNIMGSDVDLTELAHLTMGMSADEIRHLVVRALSYWCLRSRTFIPRLDGLLPTQINRTDFMHALYHPRSHIYGPAVRPRTVL